MVRVPRFVAPVTPNDIRLFTLLASVPAGRVVTYGQLAEMIGAPRRARWVGQILKQLPQDSSLPWHRVINAQGRISLSMLEGGRRQAERLRAEGVVVSAEGRISLRLYRWMP
ncbi:MULTISPECIES: MGMT family protein [unclassified Oceanobacter]|jgi:methylated-DNA-protein-cysteine methyltransferase-like protein|uniref:MGMT family protein n=1 Tax=unclassified Oceanobacter TaxID=2620260 RepID=UPI0026E4640A|nr:MULTISPECIES: MGMT family protein [unclassified Oceanobacter]MDO6683676.1 MGMT family protein [Oceanobacter sp. 5_MG-2023]MDP2506252.1 MGMT family protein [Oceanobacter sp. 3_MG-2023]MDP2546486.1 MGMT family protein [Oceanobacter sp. 4_MG-2023]MDP2609815.1 MGMT family protein [Oceanobacter sp. 1_MG-2023]MDP2613146.1 MGMT family protein [Oceanobacter sp. 2_MG-2023]